MASCIGRNFVIHYSIWDGEVEYFEMDSDVLRDSEKGISIPGWLQLLWGLISKRLLLDQDPQRAFVPWVQERIQLMQTPSETDDHA